MSEVRPAAVAGSFYPRDARELDRDIAEMLDGVENLAPRFGHPKALIVPHAGYLYSGPVAARAYDELAAARGVVKRVVLLGPVHRVPVRGLALPGVEAFDTPLGRIAMLVRTFIERPSPSRGETHGLFPRALRRAGMRSAMHRMPDRKLDALRHRPQSRATRTPTTGNGGLRAAGKGEPGRTAGRRPA